jgi:FkbM family methyltransferase
MPEDRLMEKNPLWVVDVGASGGIDPRWSRITDNYKAVMFEPDPREYEQLVRKCGNNMMVLNSALSDSKGTVDFHLCRKQEVSSVYIPNVDFLKKFSGIDRFDVIKKIALKADTLGNQLRINQVPEVDFIKIDTQGYELPILRGGGDYLDRVIGLELEVEFVPLYKEQPLFTDVNEFVTKAGFELFDMRRYYWQRKESVHAGNQKGQLVFGDALYFRSPEQVLSMRNVSQEKIARAVYVYLASGYLDLAQALLKGDDATKKLGINYRDALSKTVSRHRKKSLPDFKGRYKLQRFFERIGAMFSGGGSDRSVGNP